MIKKLQQITILASMLTVLLVPATALAVAVYDNPLDEVCSKQPEAAVCAQTPDNPITGADGVLGKIIKIVAWVSGVAAVIMIILAGIQYMTSSGEPEKINTAKNTILYAIIGLMITIIAQSIIQFVLKKYAS